MLFSGLQRNEVQETSSLNLIPGVVPRSLFLLPSCLFLKNLYENIRAVIREGIELIEQTHGLFALVREHQLEVREGSPRIKFGFFHHHGAFHSVVGHVPPCRGMEGQACQKY